MDETVTPDRPKFVYEPDTAAGEFVMLIAREEEPTVDGRMFAEGAVEWRELPIPLTMNRLNTAEGQHKTAMGIGAITEIWRDGNSIFGRGFFSADEHGQEARALIKEGTISGVSADVGGVISEELTADDDFPDGVRKIIRKGTIIGVTALLHASFNDTKIAVNESPILASAGVAWQPPADAFTNPKLREPTPLTITADGRVYGHAALWDTCHIGYRDRCVRPPRSKSNYAYFNTGTVLTAASNPIHVGRITADTGHAPLEFGVQPAVAHYDNTGYAAAFVAAGEDNHGVWFSGMLAPGVSDAQIANLRAAGVSGDWRNVGGNLEMVGLLAVNTPGFPIPRPAAAMTAGATTAIVAAGALVPVPDEEPPTPVEEEVTAESVVEEFGCTDCDKKKPCKECGEEDSDELALHGELIEWSTDHDSTYLTMLSEKIRDVLELAARARASDNQLGAPVQSFAVNLTTALGPTVDLIRRSLGRENVAPAEIVFEQTTHELTVEQRLALLDADLEVLGIEL